jgi:hypothetical protein
MNCNEDAAEPISIIQGDDSANSTSGQQILLDFPSLAVRPPQFSKLDELMEAAMKLSKHRVLLCGIFSPLLALVLYALVYGTLTRFSADRCSCNTGPT